MKLWADDGTVDYSCTCPVGSDGGFCKHCVAVGLAFLQSAAAALAPCSDYTGRFRKSKKPTITIDDVRAHLAADHRTHTAYVLVPENEYGAMREVIDDERRERAMHAVALRNAADRLDEIP